MASFHELTTAQLKQAVQIREQIEELQGRLDTLLGGGTPKTTVSRGKGKRVMSPATKKKMAAAQQARWAKLKATPTPGAKLKATPTPTKSSAKAAPKKRGAITAAGRAKLSAVMKARWAARKKGAPAPNASAN